MMTQNEIKLLRGFLIESKMTQKEFSKEAGICERTLRTAIKTGKVSDKTWNKILNEIMAETMQRCIIFQMPRRREFTGLKLSLIVSAIIAAAIAASIF